MPVWLKWVFRILTLGLSVLVEHSKAKSVVGCPATCANYGDTHCLADGPCTKPELECRYATKKKD